MQHLNSSTGITSDDGRDAIVNKMGLSAPFDTFTGDYESKNAFANVASELAKEGKTSVAWSFNATPSVDDWRADFLAPLTEYTERNVHGMTLQRHSQRNGLLLGSSERAVKFSKS